MCFFSPCGWQPLGLTAIGLDNLFLHLGCLSFFRLELVSFSFLPVELWNFLSFLALFSFFGLFFLVWRMSRGLRAVGVRFFYAAFPLPVSSLLFP